MLDHKELLKKYLEKHSIKHGEFTLRSGKKSNFYVDCRPVILSHIGHVLMSHVIEPHLNNLKCKYIAATGVGGVHIASALCIKSKEFDVLHVRSEKKAHGTMNKIEKPIYFVDTGNIVIVDDVLTTGSSINLCMDSILSEKLNPVGVVILVDREEGGKEAIENSYNIPVVSVFKKSDF
jgi:orotate phosphoribosyltransferase